MACYRQYSVFVWAQCFRGLSVLGLVLGNPLSQLVIIQLCRAQVDRQFAVWQLLSVVRLLRRASDDPDAVLLACIQSGYLWRGHSSA